MAKIKTKVEFTLHPWAADMFAVISTVYKTSDEPLGYGDGHWIGKAQAHAIVKALVDTGKYRAVYTNKGQDSEIININLKGKPRQGLFVQMLDEDEVDGEISHIMGWFDLERIAACKRIHLASDEEGTTGPLRPLNYGKTLTFRERVLSVVSAMDQPINMADIVQQLASTWPGKGVAVSSIYAILSDAVRSGVLKKVKDGWIRSEGTA